jgi:ATP-dependent RNA helicase DDX46/PRP5
MGRKESRNRSSSRSRSSSKSVNKKRRRQRNDSSESDGYDRRKYQRGNRRGGRRNGNRRNSNSSSRSSREDKKFKEDRKKQERLARARALAYEEKKDGMGSKPLQTEQKVVGTVGNNSGKLTHVAKHFETGKESDKNKTGAVIEDELNQRYEDLDKKKEGGAESKEESSRLDYIKKMGLIDELEMGQESQPKEILNEDEIKQAKELFKREWKRKKNQRYDQPEIEDQDDDVGDVFKAYQQKPDLNQAPTTAQTPIGIQFTIDDEDNDEEEEDKIENELEEDPLEAYMKKVEKKAVKQEEFNLMHHLMKHLPEEYQTQANAVSKDLVCTFEDLQNHKQPANGMYISGQIDGEHQSGEEEENEEDLTEFVQALKDIDKLKEVERPEDMMEDKNSSLCSDSDSEVIDDVKNTQADYFAKREKMAEKKSLKIINHENVEYLPFRKNLYIEIEEITQKSEEEIDFFRKELGDIKIRGLDCPRPIQNWYQCGLSDKIFKVLIEKNKFEYPFAIQCQAIPVIMSGRDCIGIAETGSGKTLGYVLPMLRHILDQRPLQDGDGPIALIMVPTRELADQVHRDTKQFCKVLGLNAVCIYGGNGVAGQLSELKRGAEIIICTPGRMIEVLTTSKGKITNLKRVTYVVLDEADRMFDNGFEPQISKILANTRPDRQTVMFSATFPRNVETLAKKILTKPIEISVGNRGQVGRNITQIIEVLDADKKPIRLLELLGFWSEKGQILIFVDKQVEADHLFTELIKFKHNPLVLHGGQDQVDRQFTINDFKRGVKTIMIATSLCARGLDIKNLVLVINYSCPTHKEDYTHRIGRTGRAGNKGTAITFITAEEDKYAGDIIQALQLGNLEPPLELVRLHERFMVKVRRGEAKEIKNRNLAGSGFRFTAEEICKMIEFKNVMKSQFGLDIGATENNSDKNVTVGSLKKEKEEIKKGAKDQGTEKMMKDPKTRDAIRKAATKAATQAIISGAKSEEVLLAATNAIKEILSRLKEGEVIAADQGLDDLYRARDEILEKDAGNSGLCQQNFEINDYPESTRKRCADKEQLDMIARLTNCRLSVRGVWIEPGRKPMIGQKKLHVHVEGDDQFNVYGAIEEVRKFCEDNAVQSLTAGAGYTGYVNKY